MRALKKAKIFIVDDHPVLREGLAQLINNEDDMTFSGEAGSSEETLRKIEKTKPDLVIMDIALEGISGIELTKSILTIQPETLVLIISMYDESVYVERALQAGAKGYLTKREITAHIILAIRKVLSGQIYVSDSWKSKMAGMYAASKTNRAGSVNFFSQKLSDRQLEVVQLTGQGYSTQKIADTLHVSVKTIESHYANIKLKLNLKNSHELIQYSVKWCLTEK